MDKTAISERLNEALAALLGTIEYIEGFEEIGRLPGVSIQMAAMKPKKAGDRVLAAPEDSFDYFAYIKATGATYEEAYGRIEAALKGVRIGIRTKDGRLVEQDAAFTHVPVKVESLLDPGVRGGPPSSGGVLSKLGAAFRNLPASFKSFMWGASLLAMSQEGIGIITSIYGLAQFGLLAGIISQAVNLVFRIPGSLFGAKQVKKFDAKKLYIATTALRGLLLLSLPLGFALFGAASGAFLAQYFLIQVVEGLIYGATRGMAESQIMPRLVGQDARKLETAGFLWMVSVELFALSTAFFLSPWVRAAFGANVAIGVFSAIMLSSLYFFKKIKFEDKGPAAAEKKQEEAKPGVGADSLPMREYIPYVASSFLHFTFNSLFTGVFATYTFNNQFMADRATGSYDTGSLAIGLLAAIPALLASLGEGSQDSPGDKGLLDRLSLKAWYGVTVLAAAAYLWTGLEGASVLGLAAAAALGAMTTVNRTKWMASYLSRLKHERHADVIATLNSLSVAASLLPFAVISAGKVLGFAIGPTLLGVVAAASVLLGLSWLLARQPEGKK